MIPLGRNNSHVPVLLVVLWAVWAAGPAWALSLNISPPSVEHSASPGSAVSGSITVTNKGDKAATVRAYVEDWVYADDGTKLFKPKATTPYSCGAWIHLAPDEFELAAGDSRAVRYTITTPSDFRGGRYAVIFFETTVGHSTTPEGSTVRIAGRIGSIVYLEAAGFARREVTLEEFSVVPPQGQQPLRLAVRVANRGNVHVAGKGVINLLDEQGRFLGKQALPELRVLPNETRRVDVGWPTSLAVGRYQAVLTADFGTAEPLVDEAAIVLTAAADVQSLSYDPATGRLSMTVANAGDVPIELTGTLSATALHTGAAADRWEVTRETILPRTNATLTFRPTRSWPPGRYRVAATLAAAGLTLTREETVLIE